MRCAWIDSAGDWVAYIFTSHDADVPFSAEQTVLLQELLKQRLLCLRIRLDKSSATSFLK